MIPCRTNYKNGLYISPFFAWYRLYFLFFQSIDLWLYSQSRRQINRPTMTILCWWETNGVQFVQQVGPGNYLEVTSCLQLQQNVQRNSRFSSPVFEGKYFVPR